MPASYDHDAVSHSHPTTALDAADKANASAITQETARAMAAELALAARVTKLEGVTPPPVTPPPTSPTPHDLQADINAAGNGTTIDLGGAWIATPGIISQAKALTSQRSRDAPARHRTRSGAVGSWDCSAGAAGSTFDGMAMENGRYAVLRLWSGANGISLHNATILGGYRMGVIAWQIDGFQWLGGRSANNNAAGGGEGYESGGIKLGTSTHPLLQGVTFDHIKGQGAWFDVGCANVTPPASSSMTHLRRAHGRDQRGPNLHEGFAIWECGWGDGRSTPRRVWGGGVLLSSTAGRDGAGNTMAWCPVGIAAISQKRPHQRASRARRRRQRHRREAGRAAVSTYATSRVRRSDWGPWTPNSTATAAQLTAAGIPTAPQAGH